jgi:hypothetical protein
MGCGVAAADSVGVGLGEVVGVGDGETVGTGVGVAPGTGWLTGSPFGMASKQTFLHDGPVNNVITYHR